MAIKTIRRDIPVENESNGTYWGSDAIADVIRELGVPYVLLNPGSSFRGLHDSLVNHLENQDPQILVVLHEEHAVAIAHGYTKVTGQPLAAIVHSNVGLMHATMAIYNAWADRVPVIVLGATGPVDAAKRRPWIDWLHTAQDQGALIRNFIKWDAQPASVAAAQEALLRANQIATTAPKGPVYVCFDSSLQESQLSQRPKVPDVSRYGAPPPSRPETFQIDDAVALLQSAKKIVVLVGRVSRSETDWQNRLELVERLGASVLTDLKLGAAFPTEHELHAAAPGFFLGSDAIAVLKEADVVLSLDWLDLGGTLKQVWETGNVKSKVIQSSVDQYNHNGWSMDHQGLPPVDLYLMADPDSVVKLLLEEIKPLEQPKSFGRQRAIKKLTAIAEEPTISTSSLARALRKATENIDTCLIRLPLGWSGEMWDFNHPLDYLGYDGGGGIGSGPGMAVGAALALKETNRLPIAVLGDGDYMMGVSALWTGANAQIPMLIIVSNNRSFFNDELHQERVAKDRSRPVENRWIGQRISNPDLDLAMIARGQGLTGIGPVWSASELEQVFRDAIVAVQRGESVVVDVRVDPGYSLSMSKAMTRTHDD